ncbi:MAG: hypothetical protein KC731_24155 [Myxococcales bacterium]|nr:hypothetical protein [Myxococcales bacterium]
MPNRATAVLVLFYAIAAIAFALALLSLTRGDDVMAVVLGLLGATALRALWRAAKLAEAMR